MLKQNICSDRKIFRDKIVSWPTFVLFKKTNIVWRKRKKIYKKMWKKLWLKKCVTKKSFALQFFLYHYAARLKLWQTKTVTNPKFWQLKFKQNTNMTELHYDKTLIMTKLKLWQISNCFTTQLVKKIKGEPTKTNSCTLTLLLSYFGSIEFWGYIWICMRQIFIESAHWADSI